ncbi:MAG: CBS domain-containing protein [Gammaproteobacteria bacterium]|nr:CBS domain-containing protein [Gammaproteobacteria bacterium]
MKEGRSSNGLEGRSWLDKISQVFGAEPKDRNDLIEILRDAERRDLVGGDALAMIEGVMQVSEMQVRDIMIPRSQMVVVERDQSPEQFLPVIMESGHSRFPVIGDSRDEVVGILLAKDLLGYFSTRQQGSDSFDIRDVMRLPAFIPESKRLNVLLKEFRAKRNHMAIVVDEYGGVSGLVTIEDVLEQIVGDIEDEYDVDEDSYIMKYSEKKFSVKALTPIDEFNDYFGSKFSDEEFDTIGGFVLNRFGHLPSRGEVVQIDKYRFEVLRADNRRIHLLQLTKVSKNKSEKISE